MSSWARHPIYPKSPTAGTVITKARISRTRQEASCFSLGKRTEWDDLQLPSQKDLFRNWKEEETSHSLNVFKMKGIATSGSAWSRDQGKQMRLFIWKVERGNAYARTCACVGSGCWALYTYTHMCLWTCASVLTPTCGVSCVREYTTELRYTWTSPVNTNSI